MEGGGWVETNQQLYYWVRLKYWEESWRLEETCYCSNSIERPSAETDGKNSQKMNNNKNDHNKNTCKLTMKITTTVIQWKRTEKKKFSKKLKHSASSETRSNCTYTLIDFSHKIKTFIFIFSVSNSSYFHFSNQTLSTIVFDFLLTLFNSRIVLVP